MGKFFTRLKYPLLALAACVAILAVLLSSVWAAPAIKSWKWRRDVKAQLASLKTNGCPVTMDQLQAYYPQTPEATQRAASYTNAFAAFEPVKNVPILGDEKPPDCGVALTPDQRTRIADCLARNSRCLELLSSAAGSGACRYPVDLRDGYFALMPYLAKMKSGGGLLALNATYSADAGDGAGAFRSIQTGLGLAGSLDDEPTLISYLVQTAVLVRTTRTLEWCLARCEFSTANLQALEARLQSFLSDRVYRRALEGEQCVGIGLFEGPASNIQKLMQDESLGVDFGLGVYRSMGYATRDFGFFLDLMRQVRELQNIAPHLRLSQAQSLQRRVAEGKIIRSKAVDVNVLSGMLLPGILKAPEKEVRRQAELRLALAALILKRTGSEEPTLWTTTTNGAPTTTPLLDPYNGQPMKLLKQGSGWLIYSVGPDQSDDRGRKKEGDDTGTPYDISFSVLR